MGVNIKDLNRKAKELYSKDFKDPCKYNQNWVDQIVLM